MSPEATGADGTTEVEQLVLVAPGVQQRPDQLTTLAAHATVQSLTGRLPPPRERGSVLLLAHDLLDLRRAATGLGEVGTTRSIGLVLEREPATLPGELWRAGWPALDEATARRRPRAQVHLRFAEPVSVRAVVQHLARSCTPSGSPSFQWPALGAIRDQPQWWPVDDSAARIAVPRRLFDASVDFPPDVFLTSEAADAEGFAPRTHPVLGRAPAVVCAEPDLTWADLGLLSPGGQREALERRGPLSLGPVDEKLFNPIGFDRGVVGDPVPMRTRSDGPLVTETGPPPGQVIADAFGRISDADIRALRALPGLGLDWAGTRGPQAYCRAVTTLAALGVPMVAPPAPMWARALLPPVLLTALQPSADLRDKLAREEHSIRLRRAALGASASDSWRRGIARSVGAQEVPPIRVSVLLSTRRPEMLAFALRQVARQRGVDLELVLACHGFRPDPDVLAEFRNTALVPLQVLELDAGEVFGSVLNQAAAQARGDVLVKMDDDDWYGPDFLSDLLLARRYSGAELLGCFSEFKYLEALHLTTRSPAPTETYRQFVFGGTMMVDAAMFHSIGGFRQTVKYVDAGLLTGVRSAGGRTYCSHGLGYVLRRRREGHTWDPGLGHFLHSTRVADQWRGFRPSRLLEAEAVDHPQRASTRS
jgi:hypothetical protein